MADVIPIRSRSVAQALRDALDKAERGELRSVAIAFETSDDGSGHLVAFGKNSLEIALIGELEATKLTILVESGRLHPKED